MLRLQKDFKALELDWTSVYDKLRKTMGRIVKSRAIMEAHESEGTDTADGVTPTLSGPTPVGGFLTEKQKVIQQQILRRRAGG